MTTPAPRVYLAAGEASGDMYAALIIRELKKNHPDLSVRGLGGSRARTAGMDTVVDLNTVSVMGISEVVRYYPTLKQAMNTLVADMAAQRPQVLIAIDFQEFNQRLARKARTLGIPVVFFIAPQVWAWRPRRVRKAPQYADHIATLFAFEQSLFAPYVRATHVGHPLVDSIAQYLGEHQNPSQPNQIGLLPGSRYSEIERLLPVFLKAAYHLWQTENNRYFVLPKAENIDAQWLTTLVDKHLPEPAFKSALHIIHGQSRLVMQESRLLLIASGTATLEAGLIGTPMIIGYKTSALTYVIGKSMIKTQHIGLPNIISQREIVPELIQQQLTDHTLAQAAEKLLTDETAYLQQKTDLAGLEKQLGQPGAIKRLVGLVDDYLHPQPAGTQNS